MTPDFCLGHLIRIVGVHCKVLSLDFLLIAQIRVRTRLAVPLFVSPSPSRLVSMVSDHAHVGVRQQVLLVWSCQICQYTQAKAGRLPAGIVDEDEEVSR